MQITRKRGARPSPRHTLAAAAPHRILGATPPQFLVAPTKLSYWLNDQYGDCVTAEEAFAKACNNPEILISDSVVKSWAEQHGVLNGADLSQVLDAMRANGFTQGGTQYNDGAKSSVDWTNANVLQNAISQGPVKIGVAAGQLEQVVGTGNGWIATGFQKDQNLDHCVSLCGYGPASWLAQQLGVTVTHDFAAYALFTWDTIGIIDVPSMIAITGEAWLRTPTTVVNGPTPAPTPTPVPTPTPSPMPTLQQVVNAVNAAFKLYEATVPPPLRPFVLPSMENCRKYIIQQLTRMWPSSSQFHLSCGNLVGLSGKLPPSVVEIIMGVVDGALEATKTQYPEAALLISALKPMLDDELRRLLS